MPRTRIVCTLGPACETEAAIRELAEAGMNAARLNFSHGTHEWHAERIRLVRRVSAATGRPLAVLQDLCGPKLRIGELPPGGLELLPGRACILTSSLITHHPPATRVPALITHEEPSIPVPIPAVLNALAPGHSVFLRDGQIQLQVESVSREGVRCQVLSGGTIQSRQGIAAPSVRLEIPAATAKDLADLRMAAAAGVDWVALSFVRRAADLDAVRSVLAELGCDTPVMAKIEKPEAVENLEEIAAAADGLMVARGDLGVELPLYKVPIIQKEIIRRCNELGKPVVTATQMLESMTQNPRPTRAEASDVANAILDGTDAVMLSGETAVGSWPAAVVKTMAEIAAHAEAHLPYPEIQTARVEQRAGTITDAIAQGAREIASDLNAAAILCSTTSGATARALARMRPPMPLIAASASQATRRRLCLTWGVETVEVPATTNTDERLAATVRAARDAGRVRTGDLVVLVAGAPVGTPGHTNLIKVQLV